MPARSSSNQQAMELQAASRPEYNTEVNITMLILACLSANITNGNMDFKSFPATVIRGNMNLKISLLLTFVYDRPFHQTYLPLYFGFESLSNLLDLAPKAS